MPSSLTELLAGLDREQLQALVLKLAEHEPSLVAAIQAQMPLLASSQNAGAGLSAAQPEPLHPSVDRSALRMQVQALLGSGGGRRYRRAFADVGAAASAATTVVGQAQRRIEAGDGRGALVMLDIITEEFLAIWEDLDDSSGESGDFFEELGGLWAEALLTADQSAEERQAWGPKLEAWQSELSDYSIDDVFEPARWTAEHGWEYPPLQRVLQGEITEPGAWEAAPPFWADELAEARLAVLDRQGRFQEYLYLAEAEGRMNLYLTMLARLGRGVEAMEFARPHLTMVRHASDLATALWNGGEIERALECAELGLTLDGPKSGLASWLCARAAEQGQLERALAAALIAFEAERNLAAYLQVQALAGDGWPARRSELLDRLRTSGGSYYAQGPVAIFLHEGLIEDAIAAVDQGATHSVVELVADAAIGSHPDWVIEASRQQAEGIMDAGKAPYYGAAAGWLRRARAAYQAAGRGQEWQAYRADLLHRHGRKRNLVPLLRALQ
ncbi:MAG: hypothetical protein IT305_17935 [Chloroflexi bacterium]|nr:hypothetical protein [Chloroflexota bacterium]